MRAAAILESTARAQRHLNRARDGIATLERALDLVERRGVGGDPGSRAALLAGLARARMLVAHFEEAIRVARVALDVAARPGCRGSRVTPATRSGTRSR